MSRRRVNPLSSEELAGLTTRRLLAYRKKVLALESSAELSDLEDAEMAELEPGYVYFKESSEWADLNAVLTAVLQGREHIDR